MIPWCESKPGESTYLRNDPGMWLPALVVMQASVAKVVSAL